LQATIPHLTRSSLHRLFQRHEISRLPAIEGETGRKKAFKRYPIGYFHIDIASALKKANFTCLSRLTAHRSLLSRNSTRRSTDIGAHGGQIARSWPGWGYMASMMRQEASGLRECSRRRSRMTEAGMLSVGGSGGVPLLAISKSSCRPRTQCP